MDNMQDKNLELLKSLTSLLLIYFIIGIGCLAYLYITNILNVVFISIFFSLGLVIMVGYGTNMFEVTSKFEKNNNYKYSFKEEAMKTIRVIILMPTICIILALLNLLIFYKLII